MARYSLRSKIKEMNIGDKLKAPKDYEGITIRNYASCIGKSHNRRYSVLKTTNCYIIIRLA